ncbi:hypothetical protein KY348_04685 [Candidatus Woesearchaeota archaeon]|nr:hypothetical protein [Candidatus Woesearchaeota archaeon]
MNKKGSIQLGINAIVVLIIALAVLGIALSFIMGLFRESRETYLGIIDRSDLDFHADSIKPIMFESDDVSVKAGKEERMVVSVYNEWFDASANINLEMISCVDSKGEDAWPPNQPDLAFISLVALGQPIPSGTDSGFKTIVSAADAGSDERGTYICTVQAGEWDNYLKMVNSEPTPISTQIIVTITP